MSVLELCGWIVFAVLLAMWALQMASLVILAVPPLHRAADQFIERRRARRED